MTLAQVTARPSGAPHSIYDELWHATKWQSIAVRRDEAAAEKWNAEGPLMPQAAPESAREWEELVAEFLAGADEAVAWASSPEFLAQEVDSGVTMADVLESVAVHNAYHLGKVVALRQALGAWPPENR